MTGEDRHEDRFGALIRAAGKRPAPSDGDTLRVLSAARGAWQTKVRTRRRRRRLLAIAASIASAAVLGATLHAWLEPRPPAATLVHAIGNVELRGAGEEVWRPLASSAAPIDAGASVRTAGDGRASFDLDGASLRIDRGTEIVLDSNERVTLREGRLYFDSGQDSDRGVVEIATAFGLLHDIGTQFEVRASPSTLRLRVREGRLRLDSPALPGDVESTSGEEVTVTAGGEVRRRPFPSVHDDWAWVEALADSPELDGRSAYDVLRWVARETGRRLVFADPAAELRARTTILSGSGPRISLTPMDALVISVATADRLEYALEGEELVLRSR